MITKEWANWIRLSPDPSEIEQRVLTIGEVCWRLNHSQIQVQSKINTIKRALKMRSCELILELREKKKTDKSITEEVMKAIVTLDAKCRQWTAQVETLELAVSEIQGRLDSLRYLSTSLNQISTNLNFEKRKS